MADIKKTYDVFISHAGSDAKFALEIAKACRCSGLDAVTYAELVTAADVSDSLWDALAESRALLAVLSESQVPASMAMELGAARAWNKPIFGVLTDPTFTRLPPSLAGIQLYAADRVEDVIRAVQLIAKELSEEDRALLAQMYAALGVSVDELALNPRDLQELVKRFTSSTGKAVPGERLLSELLRMRKQGRLRRTQPTARSRPHRGTA